VGTIVAENSIVEVSRIATALVDQLPDDTFVLPQPQVYGLELDWLIVAPAGLYHLDVRDWEGEVRAHGAEPWTVLSSAGFSQKVDSPLKRLASVKGALNAFLTDEAAGQSLPLIGLLAFDGPVPDIAGLHAEIAPMSLDDAIGRMADPSGATPGLETAEERQALAQGFLDRKLALRQRASRPFVLSVGGGVRARLSARTIEQLLRLLDRHPRAGVRHLLDGSLEHWLEQEGAHHLAIVVRESLGRLAADGRAALEAFMTGSGYVGLPRSRVRPSQLNMGYVTPNDGVRKALQVQRSRGRGYVHGEAGSPDSWVRVEPTRFSGNCRFTVTIDPGSLPAGQDSKSSIVVASDVGGATHTVPLTVYVRPTPTPLVSRFIRPAMGLMAGALLGGLSGLALARALGNQGLAPGMEVVALLGAMLLWGLMGAVRGAEQPAAWPTLYALGRWTLRVLGWAAVMIAIVFSLLGLTDALIPTASKATQVLAHWQPILAGLVALAVAPGTLDDIAQARAMKQGATIELGQRLRRRAVRAAVSIAVVLGLVLAVWQLRPVYVSTRTSPSAAGVEARAEGVWEAFEAKLSSYIDGLYVRAREETKPGRVNQIDKLLGWIGVKR
jgi:hypothetical protein